MFGLDNPASKSEVCERCRKRYQQGELKHFVAFTDCLFYQRYSTVYGCEVCYSCLLFINRLGESKLEIATIIGLVGFLVAYQKQSAAVHVTLIVLDDGKYRPQFRNL